MHTLPPYTIQSWVFVSVRSLNSSTTLHGGDGGRKALFSPFEVSKTSESPFRTVSQLILSPMVGRQTECIMWKLQK